MQGEQSSGVPNRSAARQQEVARVGAAGAEAGRPSGSRPPPSRERPRRRPRRRRRARAGARTGGQSAGDGGGLAVRGAGQEQHDGGGRAGPAGQPLASRPPRRALGARGTSPTGPRGARSRLGSPTSPSRRMDATRPGTTSGTARTRIPSPPAPPTRAASGSCSNSEPARNRVLARRVPRLVGSRLERQRKENQQTSRHFMVFWPGGWTSRMSHWPRLYARHGKNNSGLVLETICRTYIPKAALRIL